MTVGFVLFLVALSFKLAVSTQGPCGTYNTTAEALKIVHNAAMAIYNHRSTEHYTQGTERWYGIAHKVCPPAAPTYSDCSSAVTWAYWTAFGNGADFLNGEKWAAGYTGTLVSHGTKVAKLPDDLKVGDLCFYYQPMHHVAIYVGDGKVVSHGRDPASLLNWNYATVDECHRYQ